MSFSLYDATIPGFVRTVDAVKSIMVKAQEHYTSTGLDVQSIPSLKLVDDMLPFSAQINLVRHQTLHAIQGVHAGKFSPPTPEAANGFEDLLKRLDDTSVKLKSFSPSDVNDYADKPVVFEAGSFKLPFTGTGFLMSFATPNLHFHASTAYNLLRLQGVPLGKADYLGAMDIANP